MASLIRWDSIVIGAGCAGLAAATKLAEQGKRVLVVEKRSILGGRASSFVDSASGETIDNGQHLFLGAYEETKNYLKRIGTLPKLRFQSRFATPMFGPQRSGVLSTASLPAPFHLAWGIFRYRPLTFRERYEALRVAKALRKNSADLSTLSVDEWLRGLGQGPAARASLWTPLTLATLNISPDEAPANLLAVVLRDGFLASREAARGGLSSVGLSELHGEPSARYIEERRGEVRRNTAVRCLLLEGKKVLGIQCTSGEMEYSSDVILALPPPALREVGESSGEDLRRHFSVTSRLRGSPILSLHVWVEGKLFEPPFVGLWDRPFHWIFRKAAFYSDSSVRHLSLVISASNAFDQMTKEEMTSLAEEDLRFVTGNQTLKIRRMVQVKEPEATWVPPLGDTSARLSTRTPLINLFLAGDWTNTGLPATIESAVKSGHAAALAVLEASGNSITRRLQG